MFHLIPPVDIKASFDDKGFDESFFLVLKPQKARTTAQRAMAAYYNRFQFKV